MKKTTSKLQLKKHTVRILQRSELEHVAGAAPTANCSQQATGCGKVADGYLPAHDNKPDRNGL
ncbi:MAG TPA: hypothetical protein VK932_17720 [Kofleriaceae bacterium]|nr:hypothetical protein [Kofleriaceae bacterium]